MDAFENEKLARAFLISGCTNYVCSGTSNYTCMNRRNQIYRCVCITDITWRYVCKEALAHGKFVMEAVIILALVEETK